MEQVPDTTRRTVARLLLWSPLIILALCVLIRIGYFLLRATANEFDPKSRGIEEFTELLEVWGDAHGYTVLPEGREWETIEDPPSFSEQYAFHLLLRSPSGNILPCTLYSSKLHSHATVLQIELEEPIPVAALLKRSELIPLAEFIFSTFTPKLVESPETGFGELCYAALHDRMETSLRLPYANAHLSFASRPMYFWESSQGLDGFIVRVSKTEEGYTRFLGWYWRFV